LITLLKRLTDQIASQRGTLICVSASGNYLLCCDRKERPEEIIICDY